MELKTLKYALRLLVKQPAFALVTVITVAFGVSVNTAMFSVINSILLRPLSVPDPQQIVVMAEQGKGSASFSGVSRPDLVDFKNQSGSMVDLAAYQFSMVGLSHQGTSGIAAIDYVTGNFFTMLGVKPEAGRLFSPEEGTTPGADPLIVLGYSYWQRRFHGDTAILGKTLVANGHALTVIGITEARFQGPSILAQTDAYVPISMGTIANESSRFWTKRETRNLKVLGRLRPGVGLEQAEALLNTVSLRLARDYPDTDSGLVVRLFPERLARPEPTDSRRLPILGILFLLLSGTVLLVACVNVANIWMVRSVVRQRELAIRSALGALRRRLVRQSVTESIVLAVLGGLVGIILGAWACSLLEDIRLYIDFPLALNFSIDWRVFTYSLILALLTGLIVGIAPALQASRANISQILNHASKSVSSGRWQRSLRSMLVVGQIASSLVLLIVAGLFVRSLREAQHMYLGFDPDRLLNVTMDAHQIGYNETQGAIFYRKLISQVRTVPGVESASLSFSVPFGFIHETTEIYPEGHTLENGTRPPVIFYNTVDPAYFDNLRISLIRGRLFTEDDNESSPFVAIINETMARRFWPIDDAVGKRFAVTNSSPAILLQVIGIVKDGRYLDPTDDVQPYFFRPLAQQYVSVRTLQIRTSVPPETMVPRIREIIQAMAPDLPTFDFRPMKEALNGLNGFFVFRLGAGLAAALGFLGLVLAVVGVYGLVSYDMSQRTQEIGIRMALGAQRSNILKMVLRQSLTVAAIGIAVGLVLAFAAGHAMKSLFVGVGAADPLTFIATSLLLGGITLLASAIPAWRVLHIDPSTTLRSQ